MNKILVLVAILAAAGIAYFLMSAEKAESPKTEAVTGTLPQDTSDAAVDPQAAKAAASLISTSPENADVFILEPGNGATVTSPITVKFGITGMGVAPAGTNTENSGHHHLLINLDTLPPLNQPLPATDQLIHFGAGQTETSIALEPGEHTLQLVLGNYLHIPHEPPVISKKITITVQ